MNWLQKISQNIKVSLGNYPDKLKQYLYDLSDSSVARDKEFPYTREDADTDISRLLQQTQHNMQKIVQLIQNAVSSASIQSTITVKAAHPPSEMNWGEDYTKPVSDAYIVVGDKTAWGGAAEFTLFVDDNGIEVDDVLEAGDADFFTDPVIQADYFKLVRELKYPGSNKSSKILSLYTARPVQDRHIYIDATAVPSNLFLTNSYSHAEGIARDLSNRGTRDIWRIRIEEKYLIMTLNSGSIREYQIVGDGNSVPIKSMTLVDPGSTMDT